MLERNQAKLMDEVAALTESRERATEAADYLRLDAAIDALFQRQLAFAAQRRRVVAALRDSQARQG